MTRFEYSDLRINPIILADAYKISHPPQYPENTEYVNANITPRTSRIPGVNHVVNFGLQYFMLKYLVVEFNTNFFDRPKARVLAELKEYFDEYFGPGAVDVSRYGELHDLGYLPLRIKALPEGVLCPIGVPLATIENTDPNFGWLTNAIETVCQNTIWNPITAATIARRFWELMSDYAERTGNPDFVPFQGHNFSMRGMSSVESSITTDMGHLLFFKGSDTLPGKAAVRHWYKAPRDTSVSVPATEHAVMCAGGKVNELHTVDRLISELYPEGFISIVIDTWDLWKVLLEIAPHLKDKIMKRDGKVVFRPDSGDPVLILCGYRTMDYDGTCEEARRELKKDQDLYLSLIHYRADAMKCSDGYVTLEGREIKEPEIKGVVRLLAEEFGTTFNSKGFKELDPHVGCIYGDAITYDRATEIFERLMERDFATTNVVLGIGSFTYQYNTRDTFGLACKATWAQVDGVEHELFKDPVTDSGTKKSACGLLRVNGTNGNYTLQQSCTRDEEEGGELKVVFLDGEVFMQDWLDIQDRAQTILIDKVGV